MNYCFSRFQAHAHRMGLLFWWLLVLYGCQPPASTQTEVPAKEGPVTYARTFSLWQTPEGILLNVHPSRTLTDTLRYFITHSPTSALPAGDRTDAILRGPAPKLVCTSTTHIAFLKALEAHDRISGIAGTRYVSDPDIRQQIEERLVTEVGTGEGLDYEQLLQMAPCIVLVSGQAAAQAARREELAASGVQFLTVTEWQEAHPLGRAEWVLFFASLTGQLQEATLLFKTWETAYQQAVGLVKDVQRKPLVMTGMSYQGNWFVAGGASFAAQLFADAGARYLWAEDTSTGSLQLSFEAVYEKAMMAEYWVGADLAGSVAAVIGQESRLQDLPCVQQGQVYNNNKRLNTEGWNEYYETSVVRPHVVLQDLIRIFHPELATSAESYYYQQLPEE